MSNEPNQQMETLLREAAKKRAAEAGQPFELHPVNRRALQDEVARTFSPAPKPSAFKAGWAELLMALLPRLVLGVGIFAILGVTVYLSLPKSSNRVQSFELSKAEPASRLNERQSSLDGNAGSLTDTLPSGKAAQVAQAPASPMSADAPKVVEPAGRTTLATTSTASKSQLADRREELSKSKTPSEPDVSMFREKDANLASEDKAAPVLRSRIDSVETAAGVAAAGDGKKEVARADGSVRGLGGARPSAQPVVVAPVSQPPGSAKQTGTPPEQPKKPAGVDALAFKMEARKSDAALSDEALRGQTSSAPLPVRQLTEREVVMNAPARFRQMQPTATTNETVMLAESTALGTPTVAPTSRFYFVQQDSRKLYRRNLQSPPLPKVLTQFSLSVADGRVVLTDVDGSIYSGSVMPGVVADTPARISPGGLDGLHFRAAGTNKTSGRKVTIDGTMDAAPGLAGLEAKNEATTTRGLAADLMGRDADGVRAGQQVRGRVTVGGTQFEIQAHRVPSQP